MNYSQGFFPPKESNKMFRWSKMGYKNSKYRHVTVVFSTQIHLPRHNTGIISRNVDFRLAAREHRKLCCKDHVSWKLTWLVYLYTEFKLQRIFKSIIQFIWCVKTTTRPLFSIFQILYVPPCFGIASRFLSGHFLLCHIYGGFLLAR